jgi:hypothetical protein
MILKTKNTNTSCIFYSIVVYINGIVNPRSSHSSLHQTRMNRTKPTSETPVVTTIPDDFPRRIQWYPGSGSDFFAVMLPLVIHEIEGPSQGESLFQAGTSANRSARLPDESVDLRQPGPLGPPLTPRRVAEIPVVLNDLDLTLFETLSATPPETVLYENYRVHNLVDHHSWQGWKKLRDARVVLTSVRRHSLHEIAGALQTYRITRKSENPAFSDPAPDEYLELIFAVSDILDTVDAVDNVNPADTRTLRAWFFPQHAETFYDVIAPALGATIVALMLMRTRITNPAGMLAKTGEFVPDLLLRMQQQPERYRDIACIWADWTADLRRQPYITGEASVVQGIRPDFSAEEDAGENLFQFNPSNTVHTDPTRGFLSPPDADNTWSTSPYRVMDWGERGSIPTMLYYAPQAFTPPAPFGVGPRFWVVPGRLLAGGWPGGETREEIRQHLGVLLDAGINVFINLVPESEMGSEPHLKRYDRFGNALARERGNYFYMVNFPCATGSSPGPDKIASIITLIKDSMASGYGVYVHSNAGMDRVLIALAAFVVRERMARRGSEVSFVQDLMRRSGTYRELPEGTPEQRSFLQKYTNRVP